MNAFRAVAPCIVALALVPLASWGQAYPSQTVRVVSDSAPGAPGDVAIRIMAEKMSRSMGQQVIIEPKRGAGGMVAAMDVLKTGKDGYSVLFSSSQILASKFLLKNQRVDIERDMEPISQVVRSSNFVVIHKSLPARTFKDFVAYARNNPNKVTYSTNGVGSSLHMAFTALELSTGTRLRHVPYSSGGNASRQADFFAGRVLVNMLNIGAMTHALDAGDVIPLAMLDNERNDKLPEVPALTEAWPGAKPLVGFYGVWGAKGVPQAAVDRLARELQKAARDPDTVTKLDVLDIKPVATTPAQFTGKISQMIEFMGQIVEEGGIKPR